MMKEKLKKETYVKIMKQLFDNIGEISLDHIEDRKQKQKEKRLLKLFVLHLFETENICGAEILQSLQAEIDSLQDVSGFKIEHTQAMYSYDLVQSILRKYKVINK